MVWIPWCTLNGPFSLTEQIKGTDAGSPVPTLQWPCAGQSRALGEHRSHTNEHTWGTAGQHPPPNECCSGGTNAPLASSNTSFLACLLLPMGEQVHRRITMAQVGFWYSMANSSFPSNHLSLIIFFLFSFASQCGTSDLVPWPGIQHGSPAVEVQS